MVEKIHTKDKGDKERDIASTSGNVRIYRVKVGDVFVKVSATDTTEAIAKANKGEVIKE